MTFNDDQRRQPNAADPDRGAPRGEDPLRTRVDDWLRAERTAGEARADGTPELDAERALARVFERVPRPGPPPEFTARVVRVVQASRVAARDAAMRKWLMIAAAIIAAVLLPFRLMATWGAVSYLDRMVWGGWLGRVYEQVVAALQPVVALARVVGEVEPTLRAWVGSPPVMALIMVTVMAALLSLRWLGSSLPGPGAGSRA